MAKTQIHKDIKAEVKARKRDGRRGNTLLDLLFMGVAGAVILALATHEVMRHVKAAPNIQIGMAASFIGFLMYVLVAPIFRYRQN